MKFILFDHLLHPGYQVSLDAPLTTVWSTCWQKHQFDFALWIDEFITDVYVTREDALEEKT